MNQRRKDLREKARNWTRDLIRTAMSQRDTLLAEMETEGMLNAPTAAVLRELRDPLLYDTFYVPGLYRQVKYDTVIRMIYEEEWQKFKGGDRG